MVLTRAEGGAWGVVVAWGHGVVGAGAWGVEGNAAKIGGRLCGRLDNCNSGGSGSEFQENRPNRE